MRNNILLVIVLYKERLFDTKTYRSLSDNNLTLEWFVYDNSPVPQHSDKEFAENIYYIHDSSNPGLSYAYNKAAEYARQNNFEWMLLLDQDTSFPENILEEYKSVMLNYPEIKMIVPPMKVSDGRYMSPVTVKFHTSKLMASVPDGIADLNKYSPINSGLAVNINAFFEVGGYNSNVKLDFADFQFVERFRKKYDKFYVLNSDCFQEFSNEVQTSSQKLKRFELFCSSLKNCDKDGFVSKLSYLFVVIKRMLSLILLTRSLKPFKIALTNYFL